MISSSTTVRNTYSLTQLAQALERRIQESLGKQRFWVVAEVAKVNRKGGHQYLELADSDQEGRLTSKMQANLWAGQSNKIQGALGEDVSGILSVGNRVLLRVAIKFSPIYGLKLEIEDIDPSVTYGALEAQRKKTIERLKHEGLFDLQRGLYLPVLARRLAIVGSPDSSGFRDCVSALMDNEIYREFVWITFPTTVQGEGAVSEIVHALQRAAEHDIDAILLVRGGGSKMDLHVFNNYTLCAAVCACPVPVITGIGHETDEVVAGLVSARNGITPTAAAQSIVEAIGMFAAELELAQQAVMRMAREEVAAGSEGLLHVQQRVELLGKLTMDIAAKRLRDVGHRLEVAMMRLLQREQSNLDRDLERVERLSVARLHLEKDSKLLYAMDRVEELAVQSTRMARLGVHSLEELLNAVNPDRLLRAGYTLSTVEGKDVDDCSELEGKELITLSAAYIIHSIIQRTENIASNGEEKD